MFTVKVSPTKTLKILGLDRRDPDKIVWCAATAGINQLFWIDGYLLCLEVYESSYDHEVEKGVFPISQICYAPLQKYIQIYDLGRGVQLPVVDVSDMEIYKAVLKTVKKREGK